MLLTEQRLISFDISSFLCKHLLSPVFKETCLVRVFLSNEGRSRTQITVYSLETKAGLLFVDQGEELSPTIIVNLCIVLFIFSNVNPSGFQDRCSGFIVPSRCSHRHVLQAIPTVVKTLKTRKAGFQ